jgi:hypothetical protein
MISAVNQSRRAYWNCKQKIEAFNQQGLLLLMLEPKQRQMKLELKLKLDKLSYKLMRKQLSKQLKLN